MLCFIYFRINIIGPYSFFGLLLKEIQFLP